jgi:hypothetical protein
MNKIFILLFFTIATLNGQNSEIKPKEDNSLKTEQTLPKFENVREMLINSNDYSEKYGQVKFLSENKSNLHVQISSLIVEGDFESVIKEIVKRDIVYVSFQAFAQTSINKLKITAVPLDLKNRKKYYDIYKKTITINRAEATSILKKYLQSENFSILYKQMESFWIPNEKFNKLKFEKLNEVFAEMKK